MIFCLLFWTASPSTTGTNQWTNRRFKCLASSLSVRVYFAVALAARPRIVPWTLYANSIWKRVKMWLSFCPTRLETTWANIWVMTGWRPEASWTSRRTSRICGGSTSRSLLSNRVWLPSRTMSLMRVNRVPRHWVSWRPSQSTAWLHLKKGWIFLFIYI